MRRSDARTETVLGRLKICNLIIGRLFHPGSGHHIWVFMLPHCICFPWSLDFVEGCGFLIGVIVSVIYNVYIKAATLISMLKEVREDGKCVLESRLRGCGGRNEMSDDAIECLG